MKVKLIIVCLLMALTLPVMAAPPSGFSKQSQPSSAALDNAKFINVNKLLMFANNTANFAYDAGKFFGKNDGLYFPYSTIADIRSGVNDKTVIFDAGVWVGATDSATGQIRIALAEYSTDFTPGNMVGGTFIPGAATDPLYKVYTLYSSAIPPAQRLFDDSASWINAVHQGAPFKVVDGDTVPDMIGDMMSWCVFNDADATKHVNRAGTPQVAGLEISQTAFAFKREDALGNMTFIKYKIKNQGSQTLVNTYVSLWSDPDLGQSSDDLVGCDTTLSLGFCYNGTNSDNIYGSTPPSVGMDFFQGPLNYTGNPADTAIMWGGQKFPGYKNLPMSSFAKYINGTDPKSGTETYNFMQGKNADGSPLPNGTHFMVPGDPVAGTGDLDGSPADRRMFLTTGPFTFRPGDSTEVVAAIIVGQGSDRITSVSALKFYDKFAQTAYNKNFQLPSPPVAPEVTVANMDGQVVLTWDTKSEISHGDFPFEGYTVYQALSPNGPFRRLANYDLNDNVAVIFDDVFDLTTGVVINEPVKFGNDGGIQRKYVSRVDLFHGGELRNITNYYYKVEAYSYKGDETPKTLTSATIVLATPQKPEAGVDLTRAVGDSLADSLVHHIGGSDGSVKVYVVDPTRVTGDSYKVEFYTDSTLGKGWRLIKILSNPTRDTVIIPFWANQTGGEDYPIVDGLLIKVFGPALNFKLFETVANHAGPIVPSQPGAAGFAGFPTPEGGDPVAGVQQSTNQSRWLIHTADDGGTSGGGTRGGYDAFLARTTRDGSEWPEIIPYDFEVRFTGSLADTGVLGAYCFDAYNTGTNVFWVPFELWNIGINTPNDPSDDYEMIAWLNDVDTSLTFDLSNWGTAANGRGGFEHSVSGGDNDPYTDWIYWQAPSDHTPGRAGYNASKTEMLGGTYTGDRETEVMSRMVFVEWNGGDAPPFTADMPEQGTIFRITSTKPNNAADTFAFTAPPAPTLTQTSVRLENIKVVPNPYYLKSSYDSDVFRRQIRFINLPQVCTIRIYNLAGDQIAQVDKNSSESWIAWNVQTFNGVPPASGIYIYVVEAPGFGHKVGKMAVFIQAETIKNY